MSAVYELIFSQTVYWTSGGLIYCLAQLNSRVAYSVAHISVTTVCCFCAQVDTTEQLPVQKVVSNHNAIQTFLTNSRQKNCPLVDSDFHQQFSDKIEKKKKR